MSMPRFIKPLRRRLAKPEIARQAIASNPRRPGESVEDLVDAVAERLIADPRTHSAVIGTAEARNVGLPVKELEPGC